MTIIVKIGSGVLTRADGQLDTDSLANIAASVMTCRANAPVILVSSGAITCGASVFKPQDTQTTAIKQAAAAIGQSRLMAAYSQVFPVPVAQLLLTHDCFDSAEKRHNSRTTIATLLAHQVIPIINENDTVSTAELNLGDNDQLASLTARLIQATHLILLTTVDGVYDATGSVISRLKLDAASIDATEQDDRYAVSNGGMRSKLQAAYAAIQAGIPVTIANGRQSESVMNALLHKNGTKLW
mgnify:CR=1 FL=1